MPDVVLRPPWDAFLADVDAAFEAPFELHCLGGFVIAQLHDFERVTVDVDIIEVRGADVRAVAATAGKGSRLHRRHDVYMDVVTVAAVPRARFVAWTWRHCSRRPFCAATRTAS